MGNQIRAHAAAYRAYKADFAAAQGGKIGITLNINWGEPRDPADSGDLDASETYMQFNLGWYAHAIFVDINDVSFYSDQDVSSYQEEAWFASGSSWLYVTPWGIREALKWASRQYNHPDIYITENGYSSKLANLD